jgi:hypothetical protein
MTLARFERQALLEDAFEWAGLLISLVLAGFWWVTLRDWMLPAATVAVGLFVACYPWFHRWRWARLDPSADARAYRAALLHRIDDRIRHHRTSPYWWFLPTWGTTMWAWVAAGYRPWGSDTVGGPALVALGMLASTALAAWVCWVMQRWSLRDLRSYRAAVEALYSDAE